jgi:hypothetical protein
MACLSSGWGMGYLWGQWLLQSRGRINQMPAWCYRLPRRWCEGTHSRYGCDSCLPLIKDDITAIALYTYTQKYQLDSKITPFPKISRHYIAKTCKHPTLSLHRQTKTFTQHPFSYFLQYLLISYLYLINKYIFNSQTYKMRISATSGGKAGRRACIDEGLTLNNFIVYICW